MSWHTGCALWPRTYRPGVKLGNPDEEDIIELISEEVSPESTFNSFVYSMLVTGMPQYASIWRIDDKGKVLEGHAIIYLQERRRRAFCLRP